jgi:hypothetical protein
MYQLPKLHAGLLFIRFFFSTSVVYIEAPVYKVCTDVSVVERIRYSALAVYVSSGVADELKIQVFCDITVCLSPQYRC